MKLKRTAYATLPIVIFSLITVATVVLFAVRNDRAQTDAAGSRYDHTLVIDAGHGGIDGGALALDGTRESDVNLAIALKMRAIAEFYALDNTMVRQDDSTKSSTPSYSEHDDLVCRTEIVNAAHNPVLVSIHQNSYPTGQPSGAQIMYADSEDSRLFAEITHRNLVGLLDPQNRTVPSPVSKGLYVFSHISCPAILVECGFMSNLSDIGKLTDPDYQTSVSAILLASYMQYSADNTEA